jgi:peptide/nickel transport system permease protein
VSPVTPDKPARPDGPARPDSPARPDGPGGPVPPEHAWPGPMRRRGLLRTAWRQPRVWTGLALVGLVSAVAVAGPWFAPHPLTAFVGPPDTPPGPLAPGALLGTDSIGRDVLSRFLAGGRTLLLLALLATVLGVGLGAAAGVVAAYRRGWRDEVLMRGCDVLLAFPQVIIALLFVSMLGPKLWLLVLVVAASHAPRTARVVRGAALGVVERDFVAAARALGDGHWKIMAAEVGPNVTGAVMVEAGLRLAYSVGIIAALGFLGLGVQPPDPDWGLMINEHRGVLTVQPWPVVLPVLAITVITVGANLVTDGLARAWSGQDRGVPR